MQLIKGHFTELQTNTRTGKNELDLAFMAINMNFAIESVRRHLLVCLMGTY